jgi:glycosyltransferase involved in cell wall biosynthesis
MLRDRDIICFSTDWSGDPTSKRHIMCRLARDNRVLWVDSIGYRSPRPSARDARRFARKAAVIARGCRPVSRNLWALSPPVVPWHSSAAIRDLNRRLLRTSLRRALSRLEMRDVISWSFLPSSEVVTGELGERLIVYHCVDEFSQFTGVDARSLSELEARLARRADVVFVSADRLYASKRRLNANTHLVRHGVDVEHFGRALAPGTEVPADLPRGAGPVIGFFGLVADWVDLELVRHLALRRPGWQLVLIGPVETDTSAIAELGNVHLLGRRDYLDLPRYCKGFDVAVLPFRINELTLAANPLKLREYLAAGLPVVATPVPEAERLGPAVRVARDHDEFLVRLDELLAGGATGPRWEIARTMAGESWDARTAELSRIVARCLRDRERPTAGADVLPWHREAAS